MHNFAIVVKSGAAVCIYFLLDFVACVEILAIIVTQ